jgi:hypothetical protein
MAEKLINPLLKVVNKQSNMINPYMFAPDNVIKVTCTPTANFGVGIAVYFASGTITIDWKDGSAPQNFTSSTEIVHTYVSAGTYIAEISGDILNITQFKADNARLTNIQNFKTGALTYLSLNNNLFTGILDLSNCKIGVNCQLFIHTLGSVTKIILPTANIANGNIIRVRAYANIYLTEIENLNRFPISGEFMIETNTSMQIPVFSSNGNTYITYLTAYGCAFSGTLDLSNVPVYGNMEIYNMTGLTGITFKSSGNYRIAGFKFYGNNLGYVNFAGKGFVFDANNCFLQLQNNNMSAEIVNHILVDLNSIALTGYTGRVINIGGSNADPDNSSGGYDGLAAKAALEGKGFTVTIT